MQRSARARPRELLALPAIASARRHPIVHADLPAAISATALCTEVPRSRRPAVGLVGAVSLGRGAQSPPKSFVKNCPEVITRPLLIYRRYRGPHDAILIAAQLPVRTAYEQIGGLEGRIDLHVRICFAIKPDRDFITRADDSSIGIDSGAPE